MTEEVIGQAESVGVTLWPGSLKLEIGSGHSMDDLF